MAAVEKFNWDDMEWEIVNDMMKRKIITGEKMTVAQIFLKDGFVVPQHTHINEQITQVVSGQMHFWFGENKEEELIIGPGDVIVIPANLPHEAKMIGDVLEFDSWAPRREDWLNKTDDYLRR
jgi:quercetin dioxygenase-like cupin family protein